MEDIEKLLNDEEEEVVETQKSTASEPTAEKKDDEAAKLRAENERLKKANKNLNEKLKAPKAETQAQPEPADDPLATREGWFAEIDKRSEEKAKKLVEPLFNASLKRAEARFVKARPEYASAEGKEKLAEILNAARASGKLEEEELYEEMGKTWASLHWKELETQHSKLSESRKRAQTVAADAAGASESSESVSDDFTEEEREEAAQFGKTPEAYRKAKKLLESTSINAT